MFKTIAQLMNGTSMNRVTWAPPNDLGGGDDGEGGTFDSLDMDGGQDDEIPDDQGAGGDDKINDDPAAFMRDLFGAEKDEADEDEDESETPEQLRAAEQAMSEALQTGLKNLTLPEDIIPEDFDASDPKQLRALLTSVQIHTATSAIKLVLAPVQTTITRLAGQLRGEIKSTQRNGIREEADKKAFNDAFPALANPILAPAIKTAIAATKRKHPNDQRAQIAATRKALTAMGINGQDAGSGRSSGESSSNGMREGASALDNFLGLRIPQNNNPSKRAVSSRMRG